MQASNDTTKCHKVVRLGISLLPYQTAHQANMPILIGLLFSLVSTSLAVNYECDVVIVGAGPGKVMLCYVMEAT